MAKTLSRKITIYVDGKPMDSTIKNIQGRLAKLTSEQSKLTIGTEKYVEKSKEIAKLRVILNEQKDAIKELEGSWKNATDKAAAYSEIVQGASTAMQMAGRAYGKMAEYVERAAAMDDAMADVMKTTGLTHEEVERLNEGLKGLKTRTSREELNRLASEAVDEQCLTIHPRSVPVVGMLDYVAVVKVYGTPVVAALHLGEGKAGTRENSPCKVSVLKTSLLEEGIDKDSAGKVALREVGARKVGVGKVGAAQVGARKIGCGKGGASEVGTAQVAAAERQPSELRRLAA